MSKIHNVKSGAQLLDCDPMYLRKLLREDKIASTKNEYGYYAITEEALLTFKSHMRKSNISGASYIIRVEAANLMKVQSFLKGLNVQLEPRFQYDPVKSKLYRQKRKEQKGK